MLETKQIACGVTTRHVEDIAHMLDLLPSGLWHRAPHPSFVYFPVRSAGNSEMSFDRRRYVEHAHYLHLFLIQGTSGVGVSPSFALGAAGGRRMRTPWLLIM